MTTELEPALVPELLVTDLDESPDFWRGLCGFKVLYHRRDEGFAYITRGGAHLMLEQKGVGRNWLTGPLNRPLGRGINFQVSVSDIRPILTALRADDVQLYMEPEAKWYRAAIEEGGVEQLLVTDPDGYLVRFSASIGRRTCPQPTGT